MVSQGLPGPALQDGLQSEAAKLDDSTPYLIGLIEQISGSIEQIPERDQCD